jgi:hypothetical protein
VHRELAEDDGAGLHELRGDRRVLAGHVLGEHLRAAGHPNAGHRDQVFQGDRDAVERTPALAPRQLGVGGPGLCERAIRRDGDVRLEHGVVLLDPAQVRLGRFDGRDAPRPDRLGDALQVEIGDLLGGREAGQAGAHAGLPPDVLLEVLVRVMPAPSWAGFWVNEGSSASARSALRRRARIGWSAVHSANSGPRSSSVTAIPATVASASKRAWSSAGSGVVAGWSVVSGMGASDLEWSDREAYRLIATKRSRR